MSKIKNGGLDQYGTGPFEQQQFGRAGIEGVKGHVSEFYDPRGRGRVLSLQLHM